MNVYLTPQRIEHQRKVCRPFCVASHSQRLWQTGRWPTFKVSTLNSGPKSCATFARSPSNKPRFQRSARVRSCIAAFRRLQAPTLRRLPRFGAELNERSTTILHATLKTVSPSRVVENSRPAPPDPHDSRRSRNRSRSAD